MHLFVIIKNKYYKCNGQGTNYALVVNCSCYYIVCIRIIFMSYKFGFLCGLVVRTMGNHLPIICYRFNRFGQPHVIFVIQFYSAIYIL